MPIYLVRHGETALNASRILQPADTPLNADGLGQARALAKRLSDHPIDAIITSDLCRAVQTAEAILAERFLPNPAPLALQHTRLLQERNLGALRGKPYAALGVDLLDFKEAPPGGESLAQFEARVAQAFASIVNTQHALSDQHDAVLIVVSHGLVIHRIIEAHLQLAADQLPPKRIANTSITIFESAPPHSLKLLNCDNHLLQERSAVSSAAFGG
jgi:2,3-bisphosphoglycerate-dependent phosphoglycerate mutase